MSDSAVASITGPFNQAYASIYIDMFPLPARSTSGIVARADFPSLRWSGIFVCGIVLCGSLTGCSMYRTGFHNLCEAPKQFSIHRDRRVTERFHRSLAHTAIENMLSEYASPQCEDEHYLEGFEQGIVDYLTFGGDLLPPLVPPRKYWNLSYRGSDGHHPGEMWLSGCEEGRNYAAQCGYRSDSKVASSPVLETVPLANNLETIAPDVPAQVMETVNPPESPDLQERDSYSIEDEAEALPSNSFDPAKF